MKRPWSIYMRVPIDGRRCCDSERPRSSRCCCSRASRNPAPSVASARGSRLCRPKDERDEEEAGPSPGPLDDEEDLADFLREERRFLPVSKLGSGAKSDAKAPRLTSVQGARHMGHMGAMELERRVRAQSKQSTAWPQGSMRASD